MMDVDRAAERLRRAREAVLAEWERRVRAVIPVANRHHPAALRDSLPELVDRIAESMATGDTTLLSTAAEHGRERAEQGEYTIEQVIREHHVLEQVMVANLGRDEPLAPAAREALRAAIQACVVTAAVAFDAVRTQELSRDQALYQHLVEGVNDYAIFSVDPTGVVASWNKGAQRMKLYRPEEIIGRHFSLLYPEDARERDEANEHLRMASDRGRYRGEGWRVRKGGEFFLADVLITPMYTNGRLTGYSKVVADLTERSRIVQERELSRTRIRAVEADQKAREDYVARLSHDLRSPLQAAKMGAELLRRRSDDPATLERVTSRIVQNLDRVDGMIQQLLELTRIRAGEAPSIQVRRCALDEVVRTTLEELATIHGDRFAMEVRGPVVGDYDPDAIRRILENLCGNAVKYGAPGHPITVTLTPTAHEVQLAVHNHGEPIPPDERERLFDPFARAASASAGRERGWGIGLAVVKGLAEAHGGRVRVDSDEQAGTTFKIDLPITASQDVRH